MALSLKPEHLKRYRQIAALLFKYGRSDLVQSLAVDDVLAGGVGLLLSIFVQDRRSGRKPHSS